jgi:GNAT superfamily N-acetyltransferase
MGKTLNQKSSSPLSHGVKLRTRNQKVENGVASLVTTYLEMQAPEQLRPKRVDPRLQVREQTERNWRFNRDLYFRVGEQWDWIDKRSWTDEQWKHYAAAPELRTFAGYYEDALAGYYELRRDTEGGVEIAYFGLLPDFIGRGLGGALLTSAIEEAWSRRGGIAAKRVWVHTCNRDHPQALANYQARGMIIYKLEEKQEVGPPSREATARQGGDNC